MRFEVQQKVGGEWQNTWTIGDKDRIRPLTYPSREAAGTDLAIFMKDGNKALPTPLPSSDFRIVPVQRPCRTELGGIYREGTRVHARKPSTKVGFTTGTTRHCTLEGCRGIRVGVRWPGNKYLTWPCSKGMRITARGHWQIL